MFLSLSYLAHSNCRLSLGFTNDGFLLLLLLLCQSINVKLNVIRIYSRNKLLTLIVDETNRPFASTLVTYRKFVTLRYTLARSHAYYSHIISRVSSVSRCVLVFAALSSVVAPLHRQTARRCERVIVPAHSQKSRRMPVPTSSRLP